MPGWRVTDWPLEEITSLMSGEKFDFAAARQDIWYIMKQEPA